MYPHDLRATLRGSLEQRPAQQPDPGDRLAAVLLPLLESPAPSLVFTRRADELPRHAGEISFPGGLRDGDEALRTTALREAAEELGLPPGAVEIVGALPPVHTFVSGILIVPFVGMVAGRPTFTPSAAEIAEILEFPVARLAEVEALVEFPVDEHVYRGWAYELDGSLIWGATARILHDFIDIVRREAGWLTRS